MKRYNRTSESLMLLISYLSLIGIWFAIPSITLFINRDDRWPKAVILLLMITLMLLIAYLVQWPILFPRAAVEHNRDKYNCI